MMSSTWPYEPQGMKKRNDEELSWPVTGRGETFGPKEVTDVPSGRVNEQDEPLTMIISFQPGATVAVVAHMPETQLCPSVETWSFPDVGARTEKKVECPASQSAGMTE